MKNSMACCYFPTTIIFVDDREGFLRGLTLNLDENLSYQMFVSPDKALKFIANSQKSNPLRSNWLANLKGKFSDDFNEEHAHFTVDINISSIHKEIYTKDRFQEVSVIVVDYAMPSMNGLEFAKQIRSIDNNFIKILMITGEADDALAVKAFNDRNIDCFIKKSSPIFYTELNNTINILQHRYFQDLSRQIVNNLSTNIDCCLNDRAFIEFFNELCWKEKIFEYYLIDEFGSYLMLDIKGKLKWLVVKTKEIIDYYKNIAKDNFANNNVIDALNNRNKIPFFFTQMDLEVPIESWSSYLHPANKLIGKKNEYYYALIEGQGVYDIKTKKIKSYFDFLNGLIR